MCLSGRVFWTSSVMSCPPWMNFIFTSFLLDESSIRFHLVCFYFISIFKIFISFPLCFFHFGSRRLLGQLDQGSPADQSMQPMLNRRSSNPNPKQGFVCFRCWKYRSRFIEWVAISSYVSHGLRQGLGSLFEVRLADSHRRLGDSPWFGS